MDDETTMTSDERSATAAEYVMGTLPVDRPSFFFVGTPSDNRRVIFLAPGLIFFYFFKAISMLFNNLQISH